MEPTPEEQTRLDERAARKEEFITKLKNRDDDPLFTAMVLYLRKSKRKKYEIALEIAKLKGM